MRMKIIAVLRTAMRKIEALLEVQLPNDALLGLRTR